MTLYPILSIPYRCTTGLHRRTRTIPKRPIGCALSSLSVPYRCTTGRHRRTRTIPKRPIGCALSSLSIQYRCTMGLHRRTRTIPKRPIGCALSSLSIQVQYRSCYQKPNVIGQSYHMTTLCARRQHSCGHKKYEEPEIENEKRRKDGSYMVTKRK